MATATNSEAIPGNTPTNTSTNTTATGAENGLARESRTVRGELGKSVTLAVRVGDRAGVGPEVVLKALADDEVARHCVVVGCRDWAIACYETLRDRGAGLIADPRQLVWDDRPLSPRQRRGIHLGQVSAAAGDAGFQWLDRAITLTNA